MKANFIMLLILFTSIFVGCKDNEKTEESLDLTTQEAPKGFKLTLELVVKKDDVIHLYYTEDGSIDFGNNPPISRSIKGSSEIQNIVFNFNEDVLPNEFRFDLGTNLEQEEISLKSITFDYLGKTKSLVGEEIGMYFRADGSNCIFDIPTGIITGKVENNVRLVPLLYPHEEALKNEINKLYNN